MSERRHVRHPHLACVLSAFLLSITVPRTADAYQYPNVGQSSIDSGGGNAFVITRVPYPVGTTQYVEFDLITENIFVVNPTAHIFVVVYAQLAWGQPNGNTSLNGRGITIGAVTLHNAPFNQGSALQCTGIAFEDFSYASYNNPATPNAPGFCFPFTFQPYTTYRLDVQANANWVGAILYNSAGQMILTQAYYLPKYTWGYTRPDGDVIISSTALGNPAYTPNSFFTISSVVDGYF